MSLHPTIGYLERLFAEEDHIFFQLIHSTRKWKDAKGAEHAETKLLPLIPMPQAARPDYIARLEGYQSEGWNIYVCMNPFPEGTTNRKEKFVEDIRNLFIETDKDKGGENALPLIKASVEAGVILAPQTILESSPGNYHIAWNVEEDAFEPAEAKAMLKKLASMFGGDMASTDLHRVLRLPGFKNLKHGNDCFVKLVELNASENFYTRADFKIEVKPATVAGAAITSDALGKIADYVEKNAEEAKFNLGSIEEDREGYCWEVTCPWANTHTTGGDTALIMLLADGRTEFNCFHAHCNQRGWSDIRNLWETAAGHKQRFGDAPPDGLLFDGKPSKALTDAAGETGESSDKLDIVEVQEVGVNKLRRRLTDLGNAQRLTDNFGDDIRYCDELGKWYVWNGVKWDAAGKTGPQAKMQRTARMIKAEADLIEAKNDSEEAVAKAEKERNQVFAWAKKSESSTAISGAITQARTMREVQVKPKDFDADIYLLNLQNGTLNLKTGEFRKHDRADLMTRVANVKYDPSACCPMFLTFLNKSQPDLGTQRFLQQGAGYTLTGSVAEDCLFISLGKGRNGKGVFLNLLNHLLGDYAVQASMDSFTARKSSGGEIRSDIARMEGARMVVASESEQEQRVAESLIKTLTGSDKITARKHYEGEREYFPQFKLWFGVNHALKIVGLDEGIWSRIHQIPWSVFIKPEERIKNLREQIIEKELSGVLNWALAGLQDYWKNGLVPSAEILKATLAFRKESDVIQRFLDEKCVIQVNKTAGATALFESYQRWCEKNGEYWVKEKLFRDSMLSRNFKKGHNEYGATWEGVGMANAVYDAAPTAPTDLNSRPAVAVGDVL